jgi:prepilin-type N-terminal cleavage/methylation domain-containing protein
MQKSNSHPDDTGHEQLTLKSLDFRGFTLVELMIGVGVSSILLLGVATFWSQLNKDYHSVSSRITQEEDAANLAFYLKHFLSTAVEMQVPPANIGGITASNRNGQIKEFDLDTVWTPTTGNGTADPIAIFFRETLTSNSAIVPAPEDRYIPVGIFLVRPTIDHYGVVAISTGQSKSTAISGAQADYKFTHIVDFKIHDLVFDSSSGIPKVVSLMITFVQRHYNGNSPDRTWCPPMKMSLPNCSVKSTFYVDITKTVQVTMRNNMLGNSFSRRVLVPSSSPPRYEPASRRVVDGVYFLRPKIPSWGLKR